MTQPSCEGYVSLKLKRKFIGTELKTAYWANAVKNLDGIEANSASLFDFEDAA